MCRNMSIKNKSSKIIHKSQFITVDSIFLKAIYQKRILQCVYI
jgi:hypothetical protein